jgi:hypothetical protein
MILEDTSCGNYFFMLLLGDGGTNDVSRTRMAVTGEANDVFALLRRKTNVSYKAALV